MRGRQILRLIGADVIKDGAFRVSCERPLALVKNPADTKAVRQIFGNDEPVARNQEDVVVRIDARFRFVWNSRANRRANHTSHGSLKKLGIKNASKIVDEDDRFRLEEGGGKGLIESAHASAAFRDERRSLIVSNADKVEKESLPALRGVRFHNKDLGR